MILGLIFIVIFIFVFLFPNSSFNNKQVGRVEGAESKTLSTQIDWETGSINVNNLDLDSTPGDIKLARTWTIGGFNSPSAVPLDIGDGRGDGVNRVFETPHYSTLVHNGEFTYTAGLWNGIPIPLPSPPPSPLGPCSIMANLKVGEGGGSLQVGTWSGVCQCNYGGGAWSCSLTHGFPAYPGGSDLGGNVSLYGGSVFQGVRHIVPGEKQFRIDMDGSNIWSHDADLYFAGSGIGLDIGDGRNDGVNRIYAYLYWSNGMGGFEDAVYEISNSGGVWTGNLIDNLPSFAIGGGIIVGQGRGDGINRIYYLNGGPDNAIYELTYSSGVWTRTAVTAANTANYFNIGKGRGDNSEHIYYTYCPAGFCENQLHELTYTSDGWQKADIFSVLGAELLIPIIGPGRNDGINRVYAGSGNPPDASNTTVEFTYDGQYVANGIHYSAATQIDGTADLTSWDSLTPIEAKPANTDITYQARSSADGVAWSGWTSLGAYGGSPLSLAAVPVSRYLQVESTLTTTDPANTPVINSYTIDYTTSASPTPTPPTPTPTPPTPTPPTPTPSGSYTPTPTSSLSYSPTPSSSYSHSPTPTFTGDVIPPVIIYIIDNINQKTYEVSRQRQDEPVLLCDHQPTFIGANVPEDFLDIFNNGDPSSKAATAQVINGETMWSSSPENPLNLGNYSAYAGPLGPTNTVWFNIVECNNGTPIPPPTTSPPPSSLPPWEEFLEINQLNLPLDIIAFLLLLFGSTAVLWPSILNFIVNTAPIAEFLSSAPIKTWGRACGIVYEGRTKKPIKKAIIRLFSAEDNKLRETVLTNDKGEFSLLVPSGRYYLEVNSTQYNFPSFYLMRRLKPSLYALKKSGQTDSVQFSSGLKDGILKNIYFGEILEVKGETGTSQSYALNLNIPLDKSTTLNLEEKAVKILKIIEAILMKIKWPCLVLGLVVALVAIYLKINILNMIILGLYFVIIFYEVYRLLAKSRPYGLVMEKNRKTVSLALVRFGDKNNQIKSTTISGADGKFVASVNPGNYNLLTKKNGYEENKKKISIKSIQALEKLDIFLRKS